MTTRNNPLHPVSIEREDGTRLTLQTTHEGKMDMDCEAPMAIVRVAAQMRYENGDIGIDPKKDAMLVGNTIGTAPGNDSILGKLREVLNKRFSNRVHVELLQEDGALRGLREQKGEKVYNLRLYPIPNGTDAARFNVAVREEIGKIKAELQPREPDGVAERR